MALDSTKLNVSDAKRAILEILGDVWDDSANAIRTTGGSGPGSDVNLAEVGGVAIALGQALMAASLPVVIASNQSAVPVSAASLPLPANAAQEAGGNLALTVTRLTSVLAQLDVALSTRLAEATFTTRINTQGQKVSAASTPVVIASDQSAIDVNAIVSIPNPLPVTGPLTDTELRATPVDVIVTAPVDIIASSPLDVNVLSSVLPTDAATETTQLFNQLLLQVIAAAVALVAPEFGGNIMKAGLQYNEDELTVGTGEFVAAQSDINGNLKVVGDVGVTALVSDVPSSYLSGSTQSLSLNPEGRLRVVSADIPNVNLWKTDSYVSNGYPFLTSGPYGV